MAKAYMTKCGACGKPVSSKAPSCPNCGNVIKRGAGDGCFLRTLNIGCLIGAIIIGLLFLLVILPIIRY